MFMCTYKADSSPQSLLGSTKNQFQSTRGILSSKNSLFSESICPPLPTIKAPFIVRLFCILWKGAQKRSYPSLRVKENGLTPNYTSSSLQYYPSFHIKTLYYQTLQANSNIQDKCDLYRIHTN